MDTAHRDWNAKQTTMPSPAMRHNLAKWQKKWIKTENCNSNINQIRSWLISKYVISHFVATVFVEASNVFGIRYPIKSIKSWKLNKINGETLPRLETEAQRPKTHIRINGMMQLHKCQYFISLWKQCAICEWFNEYRMHCTPTVFRPTHEWEKMGIA